MFPNNKVKLITPTVEELASIYDSMKDQFDDEWFGVLDAMKVDQIRERLDKKWYDKVCTSSVFSCCRFPEHTSQARQGWGVVG